MWKQGGQVRGRSSALERAQAVLSSRRGTTDPRAHSALRAPSAQMSTEHLSDLSESSLSSVPGRKESQPTGLGTPEVAPHATPLNSGAIRFLKRPSTAAQNQPKERAVSSSLRASQTAALRRLVQIENRFGKSVQRSPTRAGQTDLTVGQVVLSSTERPNSVQSSSDQSRRFVKSKPQGALATYTVLGRHSDPSEHSSQETHSKQQLSSEAREFHHSPTDKDTSPFQPQSSLSPSPVSPSPPILSPSECSAIGDMRSLEEVFPLEDTDSYCSDNGHFKINLMDLGDLSPAVLLLEEHPIGKEEVLEEPQEELPEEVLEEEGLEEPQEELEEEVVLEEEVLEEEVLEEEVGDEDYPSDFESVIHTESLSEHSLDSGQPPSPRSQSSYSNTFTRATTSDSSSPEASFHSNTPLPQPDRHSAKASRNTAGQTFHLPAHCSGCPSMELLMESLRQQLALTSRFISSSQEHHTKVLEGLGPPNYRYTTLEDTLKYISTLRASRPHSDKQTERK